RVHLQASHADEEARAGEALAPFVARFAGLAEHVMIAQHVTGILAEEALDALAEFLDAIDFFLAHAPGAVRIVRRPRLERRDHFVDRVVPRDVGHQILHDREGVHRLQNDRQLGRNGIHARHAHEAWLAVDFRGTRAALARLAVPA